MYNRYKIYYPIIPLTALLLYFIYRAAGAPFSDFGGYYFGSLELLHGNYRQVYDTYTLNALIAQKGYTGVFVSYTPFPPFTSLVFAPFLVFPVVTAKIIFNVFSVLLFLYTLIRAGKFFALPLWMVWLIPVIFFVPLRNNIFFGQSYLLLFVLLTEGFMAYKKGRLLISSVLWAIAIVFKLFPLVILFYLLAKKQYKPVLYCMAACLVLGIMSVLINGFASWQYYVFTIFPRAGNGELNDSYTYLFQSAFMLLKNLFVYDVVQNPKVLYNSAIVFITSMAFFKALLLACCVGASLQKKTSDFMAFACWITASLLLSPNGSSYSLILLLVPLLALGSDVSKPVYLYTGVVLVWLICFIPVQSFAHLPLLLRFPRLYVLLLFFFLMIKLADTKLPYKLLVAFFLLLMLPEAGKLFNKSDNSHYLLSEKLPLVYSYSINNNRLVYYYWDDGGSHASTTGYPVLQYTTNDVYIQNNQVYYKGKQLTASPDLKKEAMLVNGKDIIYLSDKNRGVGFYALRRIELRD
jgi:hypothetical protein